MSHSRLKPLHPSTLTTEIASILRHAILNGQLEPGAHVNETAVAEQLETSRGPVREALRFLEHEGLVVHYPRRGCFVRELSSQDVYEIYTLRAHLESLAVRLALPSIAKRHIRELDRLTRSMESEAGEQAVAEMVTADADFHGYICQLAQHGQLYEAWERLNVPTGILFISILQKGIVAAAEVGPRHRLVVEAIASRDPAAVEKALLTHYTGVSQQLRDWLEAQE